MKRCLLEDGSIQLFDEIMIKDIEDSNKNREEIENEIIRLKSIIENQRMELNHIKWKVGSII